MAEIRSDDTFRAVFRSVDYGDAIGMVVFANDRAGHRTIYTLSRAEIGDFEVVDDEKALILPRDKMRDLLQSIVDYAATMGVAAAGAPGTLRAKDENLKDLREIVKALLPPSP